jgi:SAM-dependent methyltransferase
MLPNASYLQGSVLDLPIATSAIDTYISFETIEHIQPNELGAYFSEVKRVLKPGGTFLCSTPIYRGDNFGLLTKYHPFEFKFGNFEATLINNNFSILETWYQWPPYFTIQQVMPTLSDTQQPTPFIVICVCKVN